MSEIKQNEIKKKKIHPSSERIKHLRHQIKERREEARGVFRKSGTQPIERELINVAGENLRHEMESDYDLLTGLLLRRGFEKHKEKAIQRSKEQNLPTAIALIDLDGLKEVNDNMGHTAGDLFLKNAANAILVASRDTDIPARTGGDEFQVLLIDTTPDLANAWKQRVIEEMEKRGVRASIGIAPVDLNNVEGSTEVADKRMYDEKKLRKVDNNKT